jgi:uncharacterized protein (TIGR02300 family)
VPGNAGTGDVSEVNVAKPELGNKHQCQHCGTKFFDLNKSPVICPKCGTVQQVTSARMARAGAVDDDEVDTEAGPEMVSLDEAEAAEEVIDVGGDEEVEIEDETADDDTFLEEEEEDADDVSGLIDGDLAGDEER